jgi:phosphonoacetaldehyde hydrolase
VEAFARFGVSVTVEEARGPMGRPKRDHIAAMLAEPRIAAAWEAAEGAPPDEAAIDRVHAVFVPMNEEVVARHASLVPGAAGAVARLRAMGLAIGSTTGYTRSIMERVLPVAAAEGYAPDTLVCADDLPESRPGPLAMYKCFVDLAVHPPSAVVKVDDTEAGIAEGVAAGCPTVGVTLSGNYAARTPEEIAALSPGALEGVRAAAGERLKAAGADHLIDTVADLPDLLERLDG